MTPEIAPNVDGFDSFEVNAVTILVDENLAASLSANPAIVMVMDPAVIPLEPTVRIYLSSVLGAVWDNEVPVAAASVPETAFENNPGGKLTVIVSPDTKFTAVVNVTVRVELPQLELPVIRAPGTHVDDAGSQIVPTLQQLAP